MKQQKWHTRGGRIAGRGFRLFWVAVVIIFILPFIGFLHPPGAVYWVLLGLMMVFGLTGMGVVLYGNASGKHELAGYYRRVAAGEESAPGFATGAGPEWRAEAANIADVLEKAPRHAMRELGTALLSVLSLCAAVACVILAAGPEPRLGWLAAALVFLVLCAWSAVVMMRLFRAQHRLERTASPGQ